MIQDSIYKLYEKICQENDYIVPSLYEDLGVKRGLRDQDGNGVLTGLTNISLITSSEIIDGKKVPCDGQLWYRGYRIEHLIHSIQSCGFGFEKIAYLLLMGKMPNKEEEKQFKELLAQDRKLPKNFTREIIMKAPTKDIMNTMTRAILTLASYDDKANDTSIDNVIRQSIQLISQLPLLAVYSYHAYNHYNNLQSMYIHMPDTSLSTAEVILQLLRPNQQYTRLEATVLDIALILHMEHGGGNNSTFTTCVVTSSGSDTYSTIAAAMSSLKGPKHGGANIKVMEMMEDIRQHVHDTSDRQEVSDYLKKILDGEAFDHKGLIYGMGHAVYSLSDPRERIFRLFVNELALEKGREEDLQLYYYVEKEAIRLITSNRKIYKGVSPNIDFFSGFVYEMLGIPKELYTAIFATARIVGWSAHRIEELIGAGKIIRPAYLSIMEQRQ